MKTVFLISQRDIERLKRSAARLKKSASIPHHEALDCVATTNGFRNWHHVCQAAAAFAPTEAAHRNGLLIAYAPKEGADFHDEEGIFVRDPNGFFACWENLLESYSNYVDEDGRLTKDLLNPAELRQEFEEEFLNYDFFRYIGTALPSSVEKVHALVEKHAFWMPEYVWLHGDFHHSQE